MKYPEILYREFIVIFAEFMHFIIDTYPNFLHWIENGID